jgi:hypothetical protein
VTPVISAPFPGDTTLRRAHSFQHYIITMGRKESPAWGYAERLSAGKNPQIRCTQAGCGHVFTGNASRLEAHFLGSSGDVQACKGPPAALVEQLKKAREEKQRKEADKRQREEDSLEAQREARAAPGGDRSSGGGSSAPGSGRRRSSICESTPVIGCRSGPGSGRVAAEAGQCAASIAGRHAARRPAPPHGAPCTTRHAPSVVSRSAWL